jgi:hypothetical protein
MRYCDTVVTCPRAGINQMGDARKRQQMGGFIVPLHKQPDRPRNKHQQEQPYG